MVVKTQLEMLMHSTATRQEGPHDHVDQRQVSVTVIAIIADRFLRDLLLDLHLYKTTSDLKATFQRPYVRKAPISSIDQADRTVQRLSHN